MECRGFITRIHANDKGLAGTLDVTGLTALTSLSAYHNQLAELDLTGTPLSMQIQLLQSQNL